jgi:N-acetyl sugar amidotransferase
MIKKQIVDKQYKDLPKKVIFCKNCVVSNQRPRTEFNADGICSACQWAMEKNSKVDWTKREKELEELCNKYRSNNGNFDVIVPGSGGKDSAFVAHQLKYKYNMRPLCVTWAPFHYTNIGLQNLNEFIKSGFTNITGQTNGNFHRKLSKLCFETLGDMWQPFTYGQKSWAFHMALKFNIKLIMYGENGELEYGGNTKYKNLRKEGPEEWEKNYLKGNNIDKIVEIGLQKKVFKKKEVTESELQFYRSPNPEIITKSKTQMHWFSYYKKWIPQENYYYAVKHTGFKPNPEGRSAGTYTKYTSLDDMCDGIHWYQAYSKFGMGRASRDAQQDIRMNHITRKEGQALVKKYDHEVPKRDLKFFLNYVNIDESYFWEVINLYKSASNVWKKENKKWILKFLP